MVGHDHVSSAFHRLVHKVRRAVKPEKDSMDFLFRRADDETAVVPTFLDGQRGKVLNYRK